MHCFPCIPTHALWLPSASSAPHTHTQRCGLEESLEQHVGATVLQTPFLPFVLQIKALLSPWQTRAAVPVDSSRWRAEEQCHPPSTPPFPRVPQCSGAAALPATHKRGAVCSCTLPVQPGLALSLHGNRNRRHAVTAGLSRAGRKACVSSHW